MDAKEGATYQHYKGGLYTVESIVTDMTNGPTDGRLLVIYRSVKSGYAYARDLGQFQEKVNRDGELIDRFRLVEPTDS